MRFSLEEERSDGQYDGCPTALELVLSSDEREYLTRQVRRHRAARSMSERCRIILRCGDGLPSKAVVLNSGVTNDTVGKWRRRFLKDRVEGLLDEMRPGRPRTIDDDQIAAVIERTLRSTPTDATHWSISLHGWSHRIFTHDDPQDLGRCLGLQPHPLGVLLVFRADPLFVDKVRDIVGLYLSPPNRALVLSVDEKSQIQALDRANSRFCRWCLACRSAGPTPISVMVRLRYLPRSMSPRVLSSANANSATARPNFSTSSSGLTLRFPTASTSTSSWTTTLPIKPAAIKAWLARRPHYHAHFTPTSASWINQVERWFAELPPARPPARRPYLDPSSLKPISAPSSSATMKPQAL